MKREPRHVVCFVTRALALALACGSILGCAHPQRRANWRDPPQACASDKDCPGGQCAIELGASQGTCSGGALPPLPPPRGDGGTRGPDPWQGPSIQPSSSDIKI